jgi:hypothetical protein
MKVTIEITNKDDSEWLDAMTKDKRIETIRNCITIGRLAMENYQVHIDGSKNLEPIIAKFRDELDRTVEKTLESVKYSSERIDETRAELTRMSSNITDVLAANTNTMVQSLMDGHRLTEKIIDPISNRIDRMNEQVENIFSIKGSSNVKGKLGENLIATHIATAFPHYEVNDMSNTGHEADFHVVTDFGKVLLEIKTYTVSVNREQIEKLYNDIKRTGIKYAIFLSTTSGIVGKKNISWEVYGDNNTIILYFPNSSLSSAGITFSFLFLKALVQLGIDKESSNTFYKSEEELHSILSMFNDFYTDLTGVLDKQTRLRYDIGSTKNSIDKLMDELYKECFELELEQKRALESIYGRIRDKLSIHGKSLESYTWINDRLEFTNWVETLGIKPVLHTQLYKLYETIVEVDTCASCYEKSDNKLVVVSKVDKRVLSTVLISKTKIDVVFEIPKDFSGPITLNHKYESFKNGDITITLGSGVEQYNIIKSRLM